MANNTKSSDQKPSTDKVITVEVYLRITGCNKRTAYAASRLFGNRQATVTDWKEDFKKHKLITE